MKRVFFYIIILGCLNSCSLDDGEEVFEKEEKAVKELVQGSVKLTGAEFSVTQTPLNAMQRYQEVIGFTITKLDDNDEVLRYARGVVLELESLNFEFETNSTYRLTLSYVRLGEDVDLSRNTSIFNFGFNNGINEQVEYYPYDLHSSQEIYPFHTEVNAYYDDNYVRERFSVSDKFVGEASFQIGENPTEILIEMFRLSGELGFRALNLSEGRIEIHLRSGDNSSGTDIKVELTPENAEQKDLRPAIHIRHDYRGDLIEDIKNEREIVRLPVRRGNVNVTAFDVVIRYYEQIDDREVGRDLLTSRAGIFRNQTIMYQFNLEDYQTSNSRLIEEKKNLQVVDFKSLGD